MAALTLPVSHCTESSQFQVEAELRSRSATPALGVWPARPGSVAKGCEQIIGNSEALHSVLTDVQRVASTDSAVLVLGETGTGKELVARAIHDLSPRRARPFVKLNCAAIPFDLLESELFGHERGAFTGAVAQKIGRFEMADTGTLLLDEIGDLPLALQPKLLRVLQEQEFERLGSGCTHRINVRLVAATHRDLAVLVQRGEFRSDLYYRLNVFPVFMPPLRERREDIPRLVWHFVGIFSGRIGKRIEKIPEAVMDAFCDYGWPGNVRELQNLVERAVIRSDDGVLQNPLSALLASRTRVLKSATDAAQSVEPRRRDEMQHLPASESLDSLEDVKRGHILRVLEETGWVISGPRGAGTVLNLHPNTLRSLMTRLGIRRASGAVKFHEVISGANGRALQMTHGSHG